MSARYRYLTLITGCVLLLGCGEDVTFTGSGGSGPGSGGSSSTSSQGGGATVGTGGTGAGGMGAGGMSAGGTGGMGTGGMATGGTGGMGTGGMGMGGAGGGWMPPTGDPLMAPDLQWTWVDFPGSMCRDGSSTGIGINLNSASDKVMIYLEGGGACFNGTTCGNNPSSYGANDFNPPGGGVFERNNMANPVADWNFIYVPYCTGDVHSGNNTNVSVPGVGGSQQFVGYANMDLYLDRIVPTFLNASQVLLTGVSAGGFGAAGTADLVMTKFGPIPVTLIDDSGPPMGPAQAPACLQDLWRQLWGLDNTMLADCGTNCPNNDNYLMDWAEHLAGKYPNRSAGLISSRGDFVIRFFYGQGTNNCNGFLPISQNLFGQGLDNFTTTLMPYGNFGTYYMNGTTHTWIGGGGFYNTTVNGVALTSWFNDILNGTISHVTP